MGKQARYKNAVASTAKRRPQRATMATSAFDSVTVRPHHVALNSQVKRVNHAANALSVAARQERFAQELREKQRENTFKDSRIGVGEGKDATQPEINARKMAREHQARIAKARRFDLSEQQTQLTHHGMALSNVQHEEEAEIMTRMRDGDDTDAPDPDFDSHRAHRTHAEIMSEVMAKSKLARADRQATVQAQAERAIDIDSQFMEIRGLLKTKDQVTPSELPTYVDEATDDFISSARMLADEARVRATDRIKTVEEVAREEKAKLEILEAARKRRMQAQNSLKDGDNEEFLTLIDTNRNQSVAENDDENEDDDANAPATGSRRKRRRDAEKAARREARALEQEADGNYVAPPSKRARTDDDLTDDFVVEDIDDEEDDEDASDDDDDEDDEDEDMPAVKAKSRTPAPAPVSASADDEIPFVFPAPSSHDDLIALMSQYPTDSHPVILKRILACHSIAVAAENRTHMELFYDFLWNHMQYECEVEDHSDKQRKSILDACAAILGHLTEMMPQHAAVSARRLLHTMKEDGSSLNFADLLTLKLLLEMFPSTDYRHSVTTPSMLMLVKFVDETAPANSSTVALLMFAIQIILVANAETKRVVPEVASTLSKIVKQDLGWSQITDDKASRITITQFITPCASDEQSAKLNRALLSWFSSIVDQITTQYNETPALPELLFNLKTSLSNITKQLATHTVLYKLNARLVKTIERISSTRAPLSLASVVAPIRTHAPVFVAGYQPGKSYDPIKERAQLKQLARETVREKKGAEKEVRRATQTYAKLANDQQQAKLAALKKKRAANFADMEVQARDTNLLHKANNKHKKGGKAM